MTGNDQKRLAIGAVVALTVISLAGIIGGILIGYLGQPVGAVVAIVTGAVGGIVAIVIRDTEKNGDKGGK